jgi:CDP-6-deoxy-D-xylo-4-hexulose-3-dehydrase
MTQEFKEKLRDLLAENMKADDAARRYWYPLSMVTYNEDEVAEAVDSMVRFRTTMWEKTAEFEKNFAAYQGCHGSVMVNSGSSADLLLAFLLTNPANPICKTGDEILVPIVTWPTQLWSPMMAGLRIKPVDVDSQTFNVDLEDLEAKIGPNTKAIFLVHLMGNPCNMDRIMSLARSRGLVVIEDCCESLGAEWDGKKVGTFGLGGAFSFFFSHHITTMEGGMVCCHDQKTTDTLKVLRAHGWLRNVAQGSYDLSEYDLDPRYAFVNWGFNVRPTELQAGFGLWQLEKLPGFNNKREKLATKFFEYSDSSDFLARPRAEPKARPAWFSLPLLVKHGAPFKKIELTSYLESEGVETRPIVAGNLSKHPVASLFPELKGSFHGADIIHEDGFYLGLSPMQDENCMGRLIECFEKFFRRY